MPSGRGGMPPVARGGAARPPAGDSSADSTFSVDPAGEGLGHGRDRGATVAAEDRPGAARVHRRDLVWGYVGAGRLAGGREIDGPSRHAIGAEPVTNETEFVALGVKGADDERRPSK